MRSDEEAAPNFNKKSTTFTFSDDVNNGSGQYKVEMILDALNQSRILVVECYYCARQILPTRHARHTHHRFIFVEIKF